MAVFVSAAFVHASVSCCVAEGQALRFIASLTEMFVQRASFPPSYVQQGVPRRQTEVSSGVVALVAQFVAADCCRGMGNKGRDDGKRALFGHE